MRRVVAVAVVAAAIVGLVTVGSVDADPVTWIAGAHDSRYQDSAAERYAVPRPTPTASLPRSPRRETAIERTADDGVRRLAAF